MALKKLMGVLQGRKRVQLHLWYCPLPLLSAMSARTLPTPVLAALVCGLCVAVRMLGWLLFPSLGEALDKSAEFSSPVSSYRSLREALVVASGTMYDGGVVHHPPLLIEALRAVPTAYHRALFVAMDCLVAVQFLRMTAQIKRRYASISVPVWLPAVVYAVNPLSIMSCLSQSSVVFAHWAIVNAVSDALGGSIPHTALFVSLAGYFAVYPALLLFPLATFLLARRSAAGRVSVLVKLGLFVVLNAAVLLAASYKVSGDSWLFLRASYVSHLNFEVVTPNLGLWWYFFVEMFTEFIPFFKAVYNLFLLSPVVPLAIRFNAQPLFATVVTMGWILLMKPYPVLGEYGFWFVWLLYFQPLAGYMRYKVFAMLLYIHGIMLSPIFYHLWIGSGAGNSNFFYAVSLVNALAVGTILSDLLWGMLRHEYDGDKPDFDRKLAQI